MTVGLRLKEERLRLGLSQTDFAALAGVKKGTQISWEKDSSSPTAQALVAFVEAGADILYVLTGRHTVERSRSFGHSIEQELAEVHRDLLEPTRNRLAGEDDAQAEDRVLEASAMVIRAMLKFDSAQMSQAEFDRANSLLEIATDPKKLSLFRAADFVQMRDRRRQLREEIGDWIDLSYEPNDTVRNLLVLLALDYGVPVRLLAELIYEVHTDITVRRDAFEARQAAENSPSSD